MQFNLIDERWIPVRRRDGGPDKIAPHEVTDGFTDNPVVALDTPRPDFNGALIQFLIGLVQTAAAPDDEDDWEELLTSPPLPESLHERFMSVHDAFDLGWDGPRFMQDFEELSAASKSIDGLLIEEPGENALKNNTDFFIKRKPANFSMCPSCCAAAIFSLQTNAPAGGRGFMTSLRGGGPLTTLVTGTDRFYTLWHSIWFNVLESRKFQNLTNGELTDDSSKFPWLAKAKPKVTEQHIHPAQYFWATPRRIRLNDEIIQGECNVCSCNSEQLITKYKELPNGTKYQEPMKHPLSPYNGNSTKAVLTQPNGIGYRHWLGLVVRDDARKAEPARVVHEFIHERQRNDWQLRLWAFGYDFVPGQNKARCWYESTIPLLYIDHRIRQFFENCVAGMVRAAYEIAMNTRSAVKKAWFKRPGDVRGNISFVDNTFWQATEPVFYDILHNLKSDLGSGGHGINTGMVWHKELCDHALKLFDLHAWNGPVEDEDPKRIVDARKKLQQYNYGNKIKELLGLPFDKKFTDKKKPIARQKKS